MFRRRTARVALPLLLIIIGALLMGPGWLRAGSSPASAPTPFLHAPPLFAAAGQPREVTAVVPGDPEAVTLVVSSDNAPTARHPMRAADGQTWVGTIPVAVGSAALTYVVTADHGGVTSSSEEGRLVVLDDIRPTVPAAAENNGRTIVRLELGPGPDQFGVRGGRESARELPAAFAVDPSDGSIHVLDTVNETIVTFGKDGRERNRTTLDTNTASDIVVDGSTRDVFVLDQAQDALTRVTAKGQQTWPAIGVRDHPFGARLAYDARTRTAFVRDAMQGRHVPVVARGQRTSAAERSAHSRAGPPTAAGDLAVEVGERSVTFGLLGTERRGFRVEFAGDVLDVTDAVVDADGAVWALVGVSDGDAASVLLVHVDPVEGTAKSTAVDPSVPGDVTRRLAAASRGVVILEGEESGLRLVGFEEL